MPLLSHTIHSAFVNTVELLSDSARYNTPQQARDLMKSIMSGESWGYLSKVADYYREKASDPSFTFAKDNNTSELFAFVVYGAIYETIAKDESLFKEWWRVTSGFKNLSNHLIDESHAEIYCDGHYFCLFSIQDNLYRPTDGCEHLKMKVSAKEDTASLEVYEEVLHMPGKDVIAFCTGSDYGQQGTTYLKLKMSTFKPSSPDVKKLVTKKLKDASDVYTSHLLKVVCNSLTNMLNWAGFKATAGARKNTIKLESIAELTGANNKLNTTLYFGVSPDKQSIGVRAREGGLSCDIRVKVANVVDYVNYERIYLTLLFKLCAELHISPFQYLISRACVQATHNFIKNLGMTVTIKDNKINTTKGEGGHNQALTYSMCVRAVDGSVKAFPIKFWLNEGDRLKALDSLYSGDIEDLLDYPENICEFGVSIGDTKKIVNEFDGRLAAYFCAEFFVKAIVVAIGDMRIKDDFKKEVLSTSGLSDTQRRAYRWLAENFLYSPRWGLGQLSFDGTKIKAFGRQGGLGFSYDESGSIGHFEFYSCPEDSANFTLADNYTATMGTKEGILHTKMVVDRILTRVFHDTPTAL